MSSPSGRRGNGLSSSEWGALVDVDPRLSEALLGRLAASEVAAYVEPAGGAPDAFTRAVAVPERPLDRLFVDPRRADDARRVVAEEVADLGSLLAEADPGATAHGFVQAVPRTAGPRVLPPPPLPDPPGRSAGAPATPPASAGDPAADEPGAPAAPAAGSEPADPDAAWRAIVEGFGREAESPVPPWPATEDVDRPTGRVSKPDADDPTAARRLRRRPDRSEPEDALPGWLEPEALDDDGHYVPPPPPPAPRVNPRTIAAALAVIAGIALLFVPGVLLQDQTTETFLVGMLLTAGGAGALLWFMRDAPPRDSGPDDGAVV